MAHQLLLIKRVLSPLPRNLYGSVTARKYMRIANANYSHRLALNGSIRKRGFTSSSSSSLLSNQGTDRPAQIEAFQKIKEALFNDSVEDVSVTSNKATTNSSRRATVVMPGGSGKTRVGMRAVERAFLQQPSIQHQNNVVLVLLPRLSLLEQTVREYMSESGDMLDDWSTQALALCSSFTQTGAFPNTTNAETLYSFLFKNGSDKKIIFSTYNSLKVLQQVLSDHKQERQRSGDDAPIGLEEGGIEEFALSLIVMDEAHFTAGNGFDSGRALFDRNIRARRRLFLTGTPRLIDIIDDPDVQTTFQDEHHQAEKVTENDDGNGYFDVIEESESNKRGEYFTRSMSNKELYGDIVYQLSYQDAINMGITVPIKLAVISQSFVNQNNQHLIKHMLSKKMQKKFDKVLKSQPHNRYSNKKYNKNSAGDESDELNSDDQKSVEYVMKALALRDFVKRFDRKNVISFSRTNVRSWHLHKASLMIEEFVKSNDNEDYSDEDEAITFLAVDGMMKSSVREAVLKQAKNYDDSRKGPMVISNVQLLAEGFDIPICDGIFLADEMYSYVKIQQALARAARVSQDKEYGMVCIPIREDFFYKERSSENEDGTEKQDDISNKFSTTVAYRNLFIVLKTLLEENEDMLVDLKNWSEVASEIEEKYDIDNRSRTKQDEVSEERRRVLLPDFLEKMFVLPPDVNVDELRQSLKTIITHIVKEKEEKNMRFINLARDERIWNENYHLLLKFVENFQHGNVPLDYVSPNGTHLGGWARSQRYLFKKNQLSDEKYIKLLEAGFVFDRLRGEWDFHYEKLREYFETHGNALVPHQFSMDLKMEENNLHEIKDTHVLEDNEEDSRVHLGAWVSRQRTLYASGHMSEDKVSKLNELSFVFDISNYTWSNNFEKLVEYYREHGNSLVPQSYEVVDENDESTRLKLGLWVSYQRIAYKNNKLSQDKYEKLLNEVDFVFDVLSEEWDMYYQKLIQFKHEHGHVNVLARYVTEDGLQLGRWLQRVRVRYANEMNPENEENKSQHREGGEGREGRGDKTNVKMREDNASKLGMPSDAKFGLENKERFEKLEALGVRFGKIHDHQWMQGYHAFLKYQKKFGHSHVKSNFVFELEIEDIEDSDGFHSQGYSYDKSGFGEGENDEKKMSFLLGEWAAKQRQNYKKNKLSSEKYEQLKQAGFIFDLTEHAWNENFALLADSMTILQSTNQTVHSAKLKKWIDHTRYKYSKGKLSEDRVERLKSIGFEFTPRRGAPQRIRQQEEASELERGGFVK